MDERLPKWIESVIPEVTREIVTMRSDLVDSLVDDVSKNKILEFAKILFQIPVEIAAVQEIRTRGQTFDKLFPMEDQLEQVAVIAGAVLEKMMNDGEPELAQFAAASIIAGDLAGNRSSPCQGQFVASAKNCQANHAAEVRRSRLAKINLTPAPITTKIIEQAKELDPENASKSAELLAKIAVGLASTARSHATAINKLCERQQTFQEDSDILWWLMGRYSEAADKSFANLPMKVAGFALGLDLSCLCRVLPGPLSAEAFLHEALSHAPGGAEKKYSVKVITNSVGTEFSQDKQCAHENLALAGPLCPLHFSIAELQRTSKDSWEAVFEEQSGIIATTSLSAAEVSYQVYIERLLLNSLGAFNE